jgi:hypothetical protein
MKINQIINQLVRILILLSLLSLTACSLLHQPISKTSNTTMMHVAEDSYVTFQRSVNELKTEFFPSTE